MIGDTLKPLYRLLVRTGLIKLLANQPTKRIAITLAYYLYKAGLIPHNPTKKNVTIKTKTRVIKVQQKLLPLDIENPIVPYGESATRPDDATKPVIVFDLLGAKDTSRHIHDVAKLQQKFADFKPLFLTARPDFALYRKYNYMLEYIPSKSQWGRLDSSVPYEAFLEQRRLSIATFYRPSRIIKSSEIARHLTSTISPVKIQS